MRWQQSLMRGRVPRYELRCHSHTNLASWALLPPIPLLLPLPPPTPARSAPPMRFLYARSLASRSCDRCRRPYSERLTGTLDTRRTQTRGGKEPAHGDCPRASRSSSDRIKRLARWVTAKTGYQWQKCCVSGSLTLLPVRGPRFSQSGKSSKFAFGSSRNSIRDLTQANPSAGAKGLPKHR